MRFVFQRKFFLVVIFPLIAVMGSVGCPTRISLLRVTVSSPEDGDIFNEGNTIRFTGQAIRVGILRDDPSTDVPAMYIWTSSLQGQFGATSTFQTSALVVGVHEVTLKVTATDDIPNVDVGEMAMKTFTITIVGDGGTEGMGEGSGEGSGEGTGEGSGEGSGEGAGETDCRVQSFDDPIINLDSFDELDSVDVEIDSNRVAHAVFVHSTIDQDSGTLFTDVIYLNPNQTETIVASATAMSSTLEGEFLSDPRIAITRMGSVFVQYLRHSTTVDTDWFAHKMAVGAKTFSAGFLSVQRDFIYVDATKFTVDLKALGDDQAANAVVKTAETVGAMIEQPTRLEVNLLDASGITRTFDVADEMATTSLDFTTCTGFVLQDPIAVTGPNNTFTVVFSRRPCGGLPSGQLYRLNRPEDNVLTGPEDVVLEPVIVSEPFFGGPFTFDELGGRHQMRIAQTVTKDAKGTTTITSTVWYRRDIEPEILVYETTQTDDGITCAGDQLNFTPGTPGTAITVGPTGDVAVIFGTIDCFDNISVLARVSQVVCSSP